MKIESNTDRARAVVYECYWVRTCCSKILHHLSVGSSRRRNRGAIRLQAAIRGKLKRLEFTERLVRLEEYKQDDPIRKIQNRWRVKKAMIEVVCSLKKYKSCR